MAAILGISIDRTEKFEADFAKKYWKYDKWVESEKIKSHNQPLENFDGRQRRCDYSQFDKTFQVWGLERSAISFLVQGGAAGQLKRAQLLCYNHLKKKGYKSKVKFPIHDEIMFWIHKDELFDTLILQEIRFIMENCCPELTIEFETTVEVMKCWGKVIHLESPDPALITEQEFIETPLDPSLEVW